MLALCLTRWAILTSPPAVPEVTCCSSRSGVKSPQHKHGSVLHFRVLGGVLPNTCFQHLRHTCTTLPLFKGVHSKVVRELLGYAPIAMTLDTRTQMLPGIGNQMANTVEDVWLKLCLSRFRTLCVRGYPRDDEGRTLTQDPKTRSIMRSKMLKRHHHCCSVAS